MRPTHSSLAKSAETALAEAMIDARRFGEAQAEAHLGIAPCPLARPWPLTPRR